MISAIKTKRATCVSGITLIEVVIAIAIIGFIATMGLGAYLGKTDEKVLRESASQLEAFAGRARTMAFLRQQTFFLRFLSENEVAIYGPKAKKASSGFNWEEGEDFNQTQLEEYDRFQSETTLSVRRWGAKVDAWEIASRDSTPEWIFSPTGLCEPVTLRTATDKSWILLHMHPLTGRVEEEESYIE